LLSDVGYFYIFTFSFNILGNMLIIGYDIVMKMPETCKNLNAARKSRKHEK